MDDLTLAEAVNLPEKLVTVNMNERPLPDNFHSRTGHSLPAENSALQQQLIKTNQHAIENQMRINLDKSKIMLFNPCKAIDFMPKIELDGCELDLVEQIKLLGIVIRSDLKWSDNTDYMVKRAYKKLWILRRLKALGAGPDDLLDLYIKQIRCLLELAAPAWNGSLTRSEIVDIERVQKCALRIILGTSYEDYSSALEISNLESLENRREILCLNFAKKACKNSKFQFWFRQKPKLATRQAKYEYCQPIARTERLQKGPISYLTRLLNSNKKD